MSTAAAPPPPGVSFGRKCGAAVVVALALGGLLFGSQEAPEPEKDKSDSCLLWAHLGSCEHNEAFMLEDNKCRNACCRHWSELEGNCARNATFMDGFCPGACAEEAARVALRKSAFDGDYEKQWEHGMALMDAHDSEGYYWICRRAPASRGRGAFREPSRGDAARSRRRLGPRGARSRAATRSSSWSARPRSRRGRSASATRRRASATARSSTSGHRIFNPTSM